MEVFKYILFTYAVCFGVILFAKFVLSEELNYSKQTIDGRGKQIMSNISQQIFLKSYSVNSRHVATPFWH